MNKIALLSICFALYACNNFGQGTESKNKDKTMSKAPTIVKTDEEWKKQLSDEEYYILRQKGTERPFTGKYYKTNDKGVYSCAACGNELFTSDMKFDSECGWPSFDKEILGDKIKTQVDKSHGMIRTEIMCAKCGGHLGHLFDDGPTVTGKRYCVNSVSLNFVKAKE
jgi:methionine-R-sulfoxide reductase